MKFHICSSRSTGISHQSDIQLVRRIASNWVIDQPWAIDVSGDAMKIGLRQITVTKLSEFLEIPKRGPNRTGPESNPPPPIDTPLESTASTGRKIVWFNAIMVHSTRKVNSKPTRIRSCKWKLFVFLHSLTRLMAYLLALFFSFHFFDSVVVVVVVFSQLKLWIHRMIDRCAYAIDALSHFQLRVECARWIKSACKPQ